MPIALTALLFVFWIYLAYRAFQRGQLGLAGFYLAVGIGLTVYRVMAARKSGN